jgi:alkanesulfonate monooxygenase SsuD/methylene tetrahydromethanopterin reductase-like flavin-dependent oxidoreductase (luciferase family)
MIAALRASMLHLAAAEADGAITTWLSAEDVRKVRSELGPQIELVARLFVIPTEDASVARAMGRRLLTNYLPVPAYTAFHDWLGRGEALRPMNEAWAAGDRKRANEAIPDHVVDELIVHGSPAQCRDHIRSYVDNGLNTPVIEIVNPGGDPEQLVRALSPRGR